MRIDHYILGYQTFNISESERAKAATALLKRNMSAKISLSGDFDIPLCKVKKYRTALSGIDYTLSGVKGAPSYFFNYKKRYGIFFGIFVILLYFAFSSSFVWDIRIEGNESISDAKIEEELESNGFSIGTPWRKRALSEIEANVLDTSSDIGWININRRGTVAYVTVREKNTHTEIQENPGYSNIVAKTDCVIEEITVKSGVACVKAGDTVKAGELLISGVIPSELGGGFVKAQGEIYGRLSEQICVEVPINENVKTYGKQKLSQMDVKIFNFSLNIFKSYRKNDNDCVIIEDIEECVLFGKYRLPLGIRKIYTQPITESVKAYSEKEVVSIASQRLASSRVAHLANAELLKIRTYGEFTESGYKMTSSVTVLRDVGEEKYFSDD